MACPSRASKIYAHACECLACSSVQIACHTDHTRTVSRPCGFSYGSGTQKGKIRKSFASHRLSFLKGRIFFGSKPRLLAMDSLPIIGLPSAFVIDEQYIADSRGVSNRILVITTVQDQPVKSGISQENSI